MKVTDSTFYVVELSAEMHVFDTEPEAITHLRENAGGVDPETDAVSVSSVSVDGEDWTVKQLAWQEIALRLMQESDD